MAKQTLAHPSIVNKTAANAPPLLNNNEKKPTKTIFSQCAALPVVRDTSSYLSASKNKSFSHLFPFPFIFAALSS
eukprot:653544-Pleurochrysis_carterae.AAC.1